MRNRRVRSRKTADRHAHPWSERRVDLPPWQPWAAVGLFAFLLHFTWELLQVPFFRDIATAPHWDATRVCLSATLGDVVITELAYGGVALSTRRGAWLAGEQPMKTPRRMEAWATPTSGVEAGWTT